MEGLEEYQWGDFNGMTSASREPKIEVEIKKFWPTYKSTVNRIREKIIEAFLGLDTDYADVELQELELFVSFIDNDISLKYQNLNRGETETEEVIEKLSPPIDYNYMDQTERYRTSFLSRPGAWIIRDIFSCDWYPYRHEPLEKNIDRSLTQQLDFYTVSGVLSKYCSTTMVNDLKKENEFIKDLCHILPKQEDGYFDESSPIATEGLKHNTIISLRRLIKEGEIILEKTEMVSDVPGSIKKELKSTFRKVYPVSDFIMFTRFLFLTTNIKGVHYFNIYNLYKNGSTNKKWVKIKSLI